MSGERTTAAAPAYGELEGLPLVGEVRGNRPLWIGLGSIALLGAVLFFILEARRENAKAPAIRPKVADTAYSQSVLPELYVSPDPIVRPSRDMRQGIIENRNGPRPAVRLQATPPQVTLRRPVERTQPTFPAQQAYVPPTLPVIQRPSANPTNSSPVIVFEAGGLATGQSQAAGQQQGGPTGASSTARRAHATRGGSRGALVPQGALLPAVLETAIDSTQPGQARALVSSNVLSVDGEKVLIPRGSRLFGDYRGELESGQRRLHVQWTKLVRPDGVTIALDSPATDTLGRAGIKGKVNSHFFQSFAGALLQSSIEVGAIAATRGLSNSAVVVALPSSAQAATSQLIPPAPKPTISVRQGTRISVLVARDLDFSSVD